MKLFRVSYTVPGLSGAVGFVGCFEFHAEDMESAALVGVSQAALFHSVEVTRVRVLWVSEAFDLA